MTRYINAPLTAGILLALAAPLAAHAESSRNNGAGAISTDARVDFRVNIPQFVSLRVGSPAATIDQVVFNPDEADLGSGTDVAATSGGDVSAGVLTARVLSNGGNVTLDANSNGPLTNGTQTIPWSEILATSNAAALPVPAVDGATTTVLAGTNGVANESAEWTFAYSNTAIVEAGQYDGRVTYTASVL